MAHKRNIEDCGDGSSLLAEASLAEPPLPSGYFICLNYSQLLHAQLLRAQLLRGFLSKATLYGLDD